MEKIKSDPSPPPIPQGGTPCNRVHWEAVPEKGIASFWKGDTLCGLKVCERGSTFHGWHMRGLSSPVKTTKSVSRGKRFDAVWEPPSMKLPWDSYCSWSVLGGWRVTGWTGKTPNRSVWFSEAGNKLAWFSDGPGRSRLLSRTHSLPRLIYFVESRVHDVIVLCEFHPIRANVTLPQKWGMRGMWLCKQIQIQDGGKCGRKHRENLPRFRRY